MTCEDSDEESVKPPLLTGKILLICQWPLAYS